MAKKAQYSYEEAIARSSASPETTPARVVPEMQTTHKIIAPQLAVTVDSVDEEGPPRWWWSPWRRAAYRARQEAVDRANEQAKLAALYERLRREDIARHENERRATAQREQEARRRTQDDTPALINTPLGAAVGAAVGYAAYEAAKRRDETYDVPSSQSSYGPSDYTPAAPSSYSSPSYDSSSSYSSSSDSGSSYSSSSDSGGSGGGGGSW